MQAIITIVYIVSFVALLYCCGLVLAWTYEMRMNKMFRKMREKIQPLEKLGTNTALFHVKKYKITEDYRKGISEIEKVQKFILRKLLFIEKSTLKTKYKNKYYPLAS